MHALENRVINPASQPPPRLLVSKDYHWWNCHFSWIVINEGVARLGGMVSNIKIIRVPCVLCSILRNRIFNLCGIILVIMVIVVIMLIAVIRVM